jgi:thiopurine S-methyltransferase
VTREFWLGRWAENRIGFHKDGVQPLLVRFWGEVAPGPGRVLLPLCGKSHDLGWLASVGHEVLGVELSDLAAKAYFRERGLAPVRLPGPPESYMAAGVRVLVGDFFGIEPGDLGRFPLAYDRAALIALPSGLRGAYAAKVGQSLEDAAHILLITIEYDPDLMEGPPYPVFEEEVRSLFPGFAVGRLHTHDCLGEEPRFRERGLTWMREVVYHLRRPATREVDFR